MRVLLSVWPYTQSHQIGFSCPQSFPVICLYRQSTVNWHFHCWQGGWDFIDWIFAVQLIISHLLWWECWVVACDQERSATKHFHFCFKKKSWVCLLGGILMPVKALSFKGRVLLDKVESYLSVPLSFMWIKTTRKNGWVNVQFYK